MSAAPTLFVVEDDEDLVYVLRQSLEKAGYRVFAHRTAEEALQKMGTLKPDLFLVDMELPGMDGLSCLRALRRQSSAPAVFLTARKRTADRVAALDQGADDYVCKPFAMPELLSRLNAVLRRVPARRSAPPVPRANGRVSAGAIAADLDRHEVRLRGKAVALTPKEFELLVLLIKSKGKVLSRQDLLEGVWGYDKASGVDTRTVDQHVSRLRAKLGPEKARLSTVSHYGYKLAA